MQTKEILWTSGTLREGQLVVLSFVLLVIILFAFFVALFLLVVNAVVVVLLRSTAQASRCRIAFQSAGDSSQESVLPSNHFQ